MLTYIGYGIPVSTRSAHTFPCFFFFRSKVRLGDFPTRGTTTSSHNRSSAIKIDIESVYLHHNKDIAIIKLAKEVDLNGSVNPVHVCLPDQVNKYKIIVNYIYMCVTELVIVPPQNGAKTGISTGNTRL